MVTRVQIPYGFSNNMKWFKFFTKNNDESIISTWLTCREKNNDEYVCYLIAEEYVDDYDGETDLHPTGYYSYFPMETFDYDLQYVGDFRSVKIATPVALDTTNYFWKTLKGGGGRENV
jgi:hypothetical protein